MISCAYAYRVACLLSHFAFLSLLKIDDLIYLFHRSKYDIAIKCDIAIKIIYDLLQFAFYFYLFGMIFLLLDSYAGTTKLPSTRSTYGACHYYQVYLPEEAMALQARSTGMSYLLEGVARHHRKNVIHFIVDK